MFRKALRKLSKVGLKSKKTSSTESKSLTASKNSPPKILTAEGWKRLMMKKYRKS